MSKYDVEGDGEGGALSLGDALSDLDCDGVGDTAAVDDGVGAPVAENVEDAENEGVVLGEALEVGVVDGTHRTSLRRCMLGR
jgi:hypothetical protein